MAEQAQQKDRFTLLVELERTVRRAESREALGFVMVNELRRLVPYNQAALLAADGDRLRVEAVSDLPVAERSAPAVQWVERIAKGIWNSEKGRTAHVVEQSSVTNQERQEWGEYSPAYVFWLPLSAAKGDLGGLWIATDAPIEAHNVVLLEHLAETFAHALQLFRPRFSLRETLAKLPRKPAFILMIIALLLTFVIPIRMSALAPVEIVPSDPFVVASPLTGVVRKIAVRTNQQVEKGDLLALLDDTELRNRLEVSRKALDVAREEYASSRRSAFVDPRSKALMAELKAQVGQREAEVRFASELLEQTRLTAEMPGVAVTPPPDHWEGRPVGVGEAIMRIADPGEVEARVMLPVKDAVLLASGSDVRIFLDSDPLTPLEGRVERAAYMPETTHAGDYAYLVTVELADNATAPRIGLQGTAKVYGPEVSVAYFLLRRPITYLRQVTGY